MILTEVYKEKDFNRFIFNYNYSPYFSKIEDE